MITLGLVDSVDDNGVYVTMPGSKGVLRGPYKSLSTVAAGTTVLVASTDDGEQIVVGPADGGDGVYNVRAFGAVGDGVTDDTAAIRAALAAIAASARHGGGLHFPDGVYRITGTLTIESENIHITGTGHRNLKTYPLASGADVPSTILNDHAGPAFKVSHGERTNGLVVEDITIVGLLAQRDTTGHAAFDFDLAGDGEFMRDFTITRTSLTLFNTAILARASSTEGTGSDGQIGMLRVTDSNIMHNKWIAQCLNGVRWNGFWFHRNDAGQNGYQIGEGGLSLPGCSNVSIVDNSLEGQRDPVKVEGGAARSIVIKNNWFEFNVGLACIHVSGFVTPVDIGPNLVVQGALGSTTHTVLLERVYGRCLDPYYPVDAGKITPRFAAYSNSDDPTYGEFRLKNAQVAASPFAYADRPQSDDLVPPRNVIETVWYSNGDPEPASAFIPAAHSGYVAPNVPVVNVTLPSSLGIISNARPIAATAGEILVATFAFRRLEAPLTGYVPYLDLRPDDAANEQATVSLWHSSLCFREDEWIVATVAMQLEYNCTAVTSYLAPYGAVAGAVGKTAQYLMPTYYTVSDVNDVKPWLAAYGQAYNAPSAGAWKTGDEILNQFPTSGGAYKWVCVSDGTPGTWESVNLA